jgi:hypothetical protein
MILKRGTDHKELRDHREKQERYLKNHFSTGQSITNISLLRLLNGISSNNYLEMWPLLMIPDSSLQRGLAPPGSCSLPGTQNNTGGDFSPPVSPSCETTKGSRSGLPFEIIS